MKFKVIKIIDDGVIAANKNNIVCFNESSLRDEKGEDSLYHSDEGIYPGQVLTEKMHENADTYWWYTKKQWIELNSKFGDIYTPED